MEGITKSFEELSKEVGGKIPSIKLDTDNINDPIVLKFKKWALIVLSCLVGGGALILIIKSIIGKVF